MLTDKARYGFCLTSSSENHVFVISGAEEKSVSRYSIAEDVWESLPELNVARECAGACTISGNIYVNAGRDKRYVYLTSVEKLSLSDVSKGGTAW